MNLFPSYREPLTPTAKRAVALLVILFHVGVGWALVAISPHKLIVGDVAAMEVRMVPADAPPQADPVIESAAEPPPPEFPRPPELEVPKEPEMPVFPPPPELATVVEPPPPDLPPPEFPIEAPPPQPPQEKKEVKPTPPPPPPRPPERPKVAAPTRPARPPTIRRARGAPASRGGCG